jgi:hypothetical protein
MADVRDPLLTSLTRRLHQQVAGTNDAFEDVLVERDVVDPLERDLLGLLGYDATARDESVGRQHEEREQPLEERDHRESDPSDQDPDRHDRVAGVLPRPAR